MNEEKNNVTNEELEKLADMYVDTENYISAIDSLIEQCDELFIMDMKKINDEYIKFYGIVEKSTGKVIQKGLKHRIEDNIAKFEADIKSLGDKKLDYEYYKRNPAEATRKGLTQDQVDEELGKIEDELKVLKGKLQKQKEALDNFKSDLDQTMENLRQDPTVAATLDEILAKRYDRQIAKLEEKKEKVAKEQKNMEAIAIANRKSPFMEQALREVLKLESDKKKLITDLNSLSTSDPDYATKVAQLKSDIKAIEKKEESTKKSIVTAVKMEKPDFTNEDLKVALDRMGQNMTILGNGEIQLDETLNRTLSSYKRQLNGIDKQILTNSVAYAKLDTTIEKPKSKVAKDVQDKRNEAEAQKLQADIEAAKQAERDKLINAEKKRRESLVPAQKLKWYQVVKRFQQWRNSKKVAQMPSIEDSLKAEIQAAEKKAEQDVIDANDKAKQAKTAQKTTMRDALKFKIVEQIIDDQTKQKWTDAKKTVKEAEEQSRG